MADPDRLLREIRAITCSEYPGLHNGMDLAELITALDEHLSGGGWPPADWIGPQPAPPVFARDLTLRRAR